MVAERTHRKRLPSLHEVVEVVTFVASDRAAGIAGTMANMSLGAIPDQVGRGALGARAMSVSVGPADRAASAGARHVPQPIHFCAARESFSLNGRRSLVRRRRG
ncbi:hypothetical protein [Spirillospora sp. NPDC048823]|uniref:hypothetical protein n=1 Tax=unclassified Spirillospora TaxID=2642701 RepID=UPI00371ECCEA